jgi:hypothetical protein
LRAHDRKRRLRTLLCCAVLQIGALVGVPMRPEQIRDLMHDLNQPKAAQTNPEHDASGGRPQPAGVKRR